MKIPLLTLCLALAVLFSAGQSLLHVDYQASDSVITNPERGFYHFSEASSVGTYNNLEESELTSWREDGFTLVFRYFYLENFMSSDISGQYLEGMKKDFQVLRKTGMKAVIRFAYGESMTFPYPDAPLEVALRHIGQLRPVLREFADVILVLQAGFIGAWGEWYYTTNYALSPGVIMPEHWEMRRELVSALLEALPESRQVQVRTPLYKINLLENDLPVSEGQAFSDLPVARISHHNDCFVSSPDDYGTYQDTAFEKPYLAADTRFTMIGGETCNPYPPISDCPNSLHEMSRFHWTYLNRDYNNSLLNGWIQQGCFEEVRKKLGYRFRMISADIQENARPGGGFHIALKLINEGWSGLINPRDVRLVIRNSSTGEDYYYPVAGDPRRWPLGDTIELTADPGIPYDIVPGEYEVFFSMPDPEPTISGNPAYSIRMANTGTWRNSSGLNSLLASFHVVNEQGLPSYQGNGMFMPVKKNIIEKPVIIIDGAGGDWEGIRPIIATAGQKALSLSVFNTADSVFFLIKGEGMHTSFQLFLDADRNAQTGYAAWQWLGNGSDYLVENGLLYHFSGSAHEWAWTQTGSISVITNDSIHELGFARSQLNGIQPGKEMSFAYINDPQEIVQASYLPLMNERFISAMFFLDAPGTLRARAYHNNVMLYWAGTSDQGQYHVLQRAEGTDDFETMSVLGNDVFAWADQGLEENADYRYRIYRIEGDRYSPAGETAEIMTSEAGSDFQNISVTSPSGAWNRVMPVATGEVEELAGLMMVNTGDSLLIGLEGPDAGEYSIFLNTDRDTQTGLTSPLNEKEGYDVLIRNDSLFSVSSEAWSFVKKISSHQAQGFHSSGSTLQEIGLDAASSILLSASQNNTLLPDFMPEAIFNLLPAPGIPGYFLVRNSQNLPDTRIIIEWGIPSDCEGYILERSVGDSSHFKVLADLPRSTTYYHDNTVSKDTAYYYRMCSYFALNRSPYTAILGGYPGTLTFGLGEVSYNAASVRVIPNPFSNEAKVEIFSPYSQRLELTLTDNPGKLVERLFFGEVTGFVYFRLQRGTLDPGLYFLRVKGDKVNTTVKVIIY